jgi:hypothetical protein
MASRGWARVRESGMRSKTFRPYDQDSLLLMPPSVRDWVPAEVRNEQQDVPPAWKQRTHRLRARAAEQIVVRTNVEESLAGLG